MRWGPRFGGLFIGLSGCVQVLGIQDWAASGASSSGAVGATSGSSTSTSTGVATCGSDGASVCLAIPAGWNGPVSLSVPIATACQGAFSVEVARGETDLVGDAATCGCTCGGPSGGSCGPAKLSWFNDSACSSGAQQTFDVFGVCLGPLGGAATNALGIDATGPVLSPGSCAPNPSKSVPPATLTQRLVCALPMPADECGVMSACVPKPDASEEPRLCVWSEGTNACPNAELGQAIPVYRKPHVDDRSCSPCACDASGETCTASVSAFASNGSCQGAPIVTTGPCVPLVTAGIASAFATITHDPGTCTPHASSIPTGSVQGQDPITLCCTLPL